MEGNVAVVNDITKLAPFNFGPVSSRDDVLYTCLRPGYSKHLSKSIQDSLSYDEQLQQMDDWIYFMKHQQHITNVIALLDHDELNLSLHNNNDLFTTNDNEASTSNQTSSFLQQEQIQIQQRRPQIYLRDLYTKWELSYIIQPIHETNSYQRIMQYIDTVYESNNNCSTANNINNNNDSAITTASSSITTSSAASCNRVIVHCASGAGRAGLVAAGCGCTPSEATNEVLHQARLCNVNRKGNVKKLEAWINGTLDTYMMMHNKS